LFDVYFPITQWMESADDVDDDDDENKLKKTAIERKLMDE